MKYYSRAFAVFWVIGWCVWSMSKVGSVVGEGPVSWTSAVLFSLLVAASVSAGWLAKKEHDDQR